MGAVLVLAVGTTLIGIGWHGRRIDRHPLCAACGYDLLGRRPGTPRCAECGADISGLAIRVGHRACRPRPLFGGLVLSLPAFLVIASMTYVVGRGIDITPHKPAWWLVYELGGSEATEAAAFTELATRMQKQLLADHHITSVADHCLESQRSPDVQWNPVWGSFLEAAHVSRKLSKEQWARYGQQGFAVNAFASSATRGGTVLLNLKVVQSRQTPGAPFVARVEMKDVRIDEEPVDAAATTVRSLGGQTMTLKGQRQRTELHLAQINGDFIPTLPLGHHELSATVVVVICEGSELGDVVATRSVEVRSPFRMERPNDPVSVTAARLQR